MSSSQAAKTRIESLDVLKGVVIILVVFGHLTEHLVDLTKSPLYKAIFCALYLFHIVVFVWLSGMMAKAALTHADYQKMFERLLLPLICLQVVCLCIFQLIGVDAVRHLLDPVWTLWYLLSLCTWRLMLPLFLRIPMALPFSVAIAVGAGYAHNIGGDLSLSRTLYYFPFFLAGYLARDRLVELVARARLVWALGFALAMAAIVLWSLHGLNRGALFGGWGYDVATPWARAPALGRLGLLALSALASLGFMAIVPRSSAWLARLGRRTLTIFTLHGFVVLLCYKLINVLGVTAWPVVLPVLLVLAVAIAWGLSFLDGPYNRFFGWLAARLSRRARGRARPGRGWITVPAATEQPAARPGRWPE